MDINNKKILFTDIDDTLLTKDKRVTDENRDAINRALAAGHKVVICSGRPFPATMAIAEKIGLADPGCFVISYNGGQIYDCTTGRNVYRSTVSLQDTRLLFDEADRFGFHIQTYDDHFVLIRSFTKEAEFYVNSIRMPYRIVPELPDGMTEEPVKVLAIDLDETGVLGKYRERIAGIAGDRLSLFMSNPWYLECVPKGISKGFAVRWLCGHEGIPIENSVSAGDSENDLPMIIEAGVGCVMVNGTDACKAAADYVTERDCDHSGLAEIIDRFIL